MWSNQQYIDYQKRNLMEAIKPIEKKIKEELNKEKPDTNTLNKLEESRIVAGLFTDVFGYNERFRNPW